MTDVAMVLTRNRAVSSHDGRDETGAVAGSPASGVVLSECSLSTGSEPSSGAAALADAVTMRPAESAKVDSVSASPRTVAAVCSSASGNSPAHSGGADSTSASLLTDRRATAMPVPTRSVSLDAALGTFDVASRGNESGETARAASAGTPGPRPDTAAMTAASSSSMSCGSQVHVCSASQNGREAQSSSPRRLLAAGYQSESGLYASASSGGVSVPAGHAAGVSLEDLLDRLLRESQQQRADIRSVQREIWKSAMGDPRLEGLTRDVERQKAEIAFLREEVTARTQELAALRTCLESSGLVRAESFSARLHRERFARTLATHPLGSPRVPRPARNLDAALQAEGVAFIIGAFSGRMSMRSVGGASKGVKMAVMGFIYAALQDMGLGRVYVCGGSADGIEVLDTGEYYSTASLTWEKLPSMNQRRCDASALVVGGHLYVCGGCDGETSLNRVLQSVERLNLASNRWEELPPMLFARRGAAAGVISGKLYLCGGYDVQGQALDFAELLDPTATPILWEALPLMIEQRAEAAAGVMGGSLYLCGGREGGSSWAQRQSVERFDPEFGSWQVMPPMLEPRSGAAAATLGGYLYVCGGMGPKDPSSVERFGADSGQWEVMPSMLVARYCAAAVATAKTLLVFGGSHGMLHLDSCEQFVPPEVERRGDGQRGTWTVLPPMSEKRMAPAVAFAPL
eukprot:TRINITY_DN34841_c0_g3_i1.p1 TRINITY_DN34841_c0_g3~~TRINITY_DN34841_c0_g3_i1.p1  ORF type:complete len:687 (+),score=140.13 TRINITY_DN34841_c0_g3_i1:187-2247(+)